MSKINFQSKAVLAIQKDMKALINKSKGVCSNSTLRKMEEISQKLFIESCQLEEIEKESQNETRPQVFKKTADK